MEQPFSLYYSFDDEGYGAVNSDTKLLSAGFSIVFIYVILTLGRFNLLEQKVRSRWFVFYLLLLVFQNKIIAKPEISSYKAYLNKKHTIFLVAILILVNTDFLY